MGRGANTPATGSDSGEEGSVIRGLPLGSSGKGGLPSEGELNKLELNVSGGGGIRRRRSGKAMRNEHVRALRSQTRATSGVGGAGAGEEPRGAGRGMGNGTGVREGGVVITKVRKDESPAMGAEGMGTKESPSTAVMAFSAKAVHIGERAGSCNAVGEGVTVGITEDTASANKANRVNVVHPNTVVDRIAPGADKVAESLIRKGGIPPEGVGDGRVKNGETSGCLRGLGKRPVHEGGGRRGGRGKRSVELSATDAHEVSAEITL